MCGIVGLVSSHKQGFFYQDKKIFESLLFADTVRGKDSTGIFSINSHGNVDYVKGAVTAEELLNSHQYKSWEKDFISDYHIVVGHNRKATRGIIKDENAHPFVENNIILVHNGFISNHSQVTKKETQVDSESVLHSLIEFGEEETLKKINGAFTLVWYNTEKKELNIIRNKERPMFIANCEGRWVFASEQKMLEWICERENIKIVEMIDCVPGTLYKFNLDNKDEMSMIPMELYSPPPIQSYKKEKKAKTTTEGFAKEDFVIGSRLLGVIKQVQKLNKPGRNNATHLATGCWFLDENIKINIFCTEEEATMIQKEIRLSDVPLITFLLRLVMSKGNKITLGGDDPDDYTEETDGNNDELLPDEFMLTDQTCSSCKNKVELRDLRFGEFRYTNKNNYSIVCDACNQFTMYNYSNTARRYC